MRKTNLLVVSFLIFLFYFSLSPAVSLSAGENPSTTPGFQEKAEVSYDLPYPGLLPDSPLYFLRVIRDKTVGLLISDPLKKAEFSLLQADKRLNASIFLFDEGKTSLALSTVSKAENYFSESLDAVRKAKLQGRDVEMIKGKLKNAFRKHVQELEYFSTKSKGDLTEGFRNELKRVRNFEPRLN